MTASESPQRHERVNGRWTVRELLSWTAERFAALSASARLEAELLLAHGLGVDRLQLYLDFDKPLTAAELRIYRELVRRRLAREPVAYILGAREFWSRRFAVSPAVLVPRPETELLVEEALDWLRARLATTAQPCVIDVGTGSGAIAVAVALELPAARVWAVDRARAAVTVARGNALAHGAPVRWCCADLLSVFAPRPTFDLVLANLPYIPSDELARLAPEVRDWEPRSALDGGGDGLDAIRALVCQLGSRLRAGGQVLLEVGAGQAREVAGLLEASGCEQVSVRRDLGGIDRIVGGSWSGR
ncbi:MAG: peptide chain release factor N(5)-glutamine methyltransferase [Proteobacteria bacterium]|nr:peptide chain release factor N(5)-glutamine methyltransferase [Pseudomonadota bacterium]